MKKKLKAPACDKPDCKSDRKEAKKLRQELELLCRGVRHAVALIDREFRIPRKTPAERLLLGKRIAKISNDLEMANDRIRYFTLKIDHATDAPVDSERLAKHVFGDDSGKIS